MSFYISGYPNCPIKAFTLYFSRLHPDRNDVWQHRRKSGQAKESDDIWYETAPVGKNTLGNLMVKISEDCGLSRKYTNHCIRSTCITVLDEGGVETRHIIGLSGHKSESSVKSYCSRLSDNKKREMSEILSETIRTTTEPKSVIPAKPKDCDNSANNNQQLLDPETDFLSHDIHVDTILKDVSEFESNQVNAQNTIQNHQTCQSGQQFPVQASGGFFFINNSTVHFHFHKH